MQRTAEAHESLWILAFSPAMWASHFMLSYVTAAIWCAKAAGPASPLATARLAIGLYTVAALIGIAIVGWIGFRRHRLRGEDAPHDADSPDDRYRFIGYATMLLSALSAVATIYSALAAVFIGSCS